MEHKDAPKPLILPVLFLLVVGLFVPCVASADPATAVMVEPDSQTVGTDATFTVNINVDPDTAICGVQFDLSFDPSLLTANNVTEGNLLRQGGGVTFFKPGRINNMAGTITGVAAIILGVGQTVSSPGTFATISFTAMAAGTSALDLSDVIVGDSEGQAVGVAVTDGQVTIGAPPAEYAITFDTVPAGTGNIVFAGLSHSNGDTADKAGGTYAIAAAPSSGYYFDSWETTGGLSVASSASATTTCKVSGAGTLRMVQTTAPPAEYAITFGTVPAATGGITFGGVGYSDGSTVDKTAGTYAIAATPGSGYYFESWETTGGVLVTSSTSATTTCEVSGAGTLRMVQTTAPPAEYTITFDAVPAATGSINFGGLSYSDEDTADKTAGTYAIAAAPGSGYYFDGWETTGDLSVTSSTSATTTCEVSGAGTLRMVQTDTAPPVNGADHPMSKAAIVAISIAGGVAIIAGIIVLVRRRRSGIV